MNIMQSLLAEFDQEMATARRVLERLPDDKWSWKAHPKANTIGWNANHIAEIPGWTANILFEPGFDMNPKGGEPYKTPTLANRAAILRAFDQNVKAGHDALAKAKDSALGEDWSLMDGGVALFTIPRGPALRTWVFSHSIHHRAILTAYYRLNGVPVPSIYGPSGDEGG